MKAEVPELNAMSLSTVNQQGRPSSRIVLIKDFDQRGFTWFTNYDGKRAWLEANPMRRFCFRRS